MKQKEWEIHILTSVHANDVHKAAEACVRACQILEDAGFKQTRGTVVPAETEN